jgi:lipopolysaccharide assembly outer membrane protein LptD (OstA)
VDVIRFFATHLMRFAIPAAALLVLTMAPSRAAAQAAPPPTGNFTMNADRTVQIAPGEVALVGNAEVHQDDVSVFADEIDYFRNEQRAVATGNVVITQGKSRIGADSANFNVETRLGFFYHAQGYASMQPPRPSSSGPGAFAAPTSIAGQETDVYFFGDVIEKIGPKKYRISNGGFTTCLQPTPRWNVSAKTIVLNMNHYTLLEQAVLNVKGVPLFYLPILYYPTKDTNRATGFLLPTYGTSSLLGHSIHNSFFWAIDRSQDLTVQHEWFSNVGQALGSEYRYDWGGGSNGSIQTFGLNAHGDPAATGIPDGLYYTVRGSANQPLPFRMRAQMSVNYFSDLQANQNFNANIGDYSSGLRQFTGNVAGSWGLYSMAATLAHAEQFYDQNNSVVTGSTPSVTVTRAERPLFAGSQVYFAANGQYAHLVNEIKTIDQTTGDPLDINRSVDRFDFSPTIRYPFKKWQFFTVNTTIQWRDTFYTRSLDPVGLADPNIGANLDGTVGQSVNRQYTTIQAQITGPVFSRVFNTPGNGYAEKFKHTIEPVFTVSRVTGIPADLTPTYNTAGLSTSRIITNDSTDSVVGGTTNLSYGLNNHFMAKRKVGLTTQTVEFLTVSVAQTYYSNSTASSYDTSYQSSEPASNFSTIKLDVRAMPTVSTNGTFHAEFNPRSRALQTLSANGGYNWSTLLQTSVGWTRFYSFPDNTGLNRSEVGNSLNTSVNAHTADNRFGTRYSMYYDILNSTFQSQEVSAFYNAQCCGIAVDYQTRPAVNVVGATSNHMFFISLTLAGLGSVSPFSGGMNGMPH